MCTVGPVVWLEKCKMWKMCQTHCRTWNMARKKKKWKMKHKHSFTWKLARKLKNVEDETQTLYDLEYGEKN